LSGDLNMPMAINPILPVLAARGVAGDVPFQPGSVIAARVLKILPDNQVRISVGGQAIDVRSQVPLQAGQTLQLAVSQTSDGVRLALLTPQGAALSAAGTALPDLASLVPDAPLSLATALSPSNVLTPQETVAVSTAAQIAATQQAGLSTLFANLGAAAALDNLPPKLQQAVAQLLARRPPLDAQLTGGEIKSAFQNSGLFLEAALAAGKLPAPGAMPDMKAALIVLRQVLTASLPATPATVSSAQPVPVQVGAQQVVVASLPAGTTPALVPSAMPQLLAQDDLLQQAGLFAVEDFVDFSSKPVIVPSAATPPQAAARAAAVSTALNMMQEALQVAPPAAGVLASNALNESALLSMLLPKGKTATALNAEVNSARGNVSPPVRGALPVAQPLALPSLLPDVALDKNLHHLLADTDAAIARQTLMQIASLPDHIDGAGPRVDATAPRWNFEIPFAMPNGTAVAQFEISRDGGHGSEAEAAKRVWRARFSLDVEPAGPVHALISLTGDKTSVRMWAERAATASQLRAGSAQLSQALIRADLQPGDIVIREGAPVQAAPASAGHFLDRAL
jgi:hypothetical protein